jgi:hypothetical protein
MKDASYLHIKDGFLHRNHLYHCSMRKEEFIGTMRMQCGDGAVVVVHIPEMETRVWRMWDGDRGRGGHN